jgi:hypothetical protein
MLPTYLGIRRVECTLDIEARGVPVFILAVSAGFFSMVLPFTSDLSALKDISGEYMCIYSRMLSPLGSRRAEHLEERHPGVFAFRVSGDGAATESARLATSDG